MSKHRINMGIARILAFWLCVAALLPGGASATANIVSTERTQTTLISDVKTIHAGDKFWVALHIQMKPGWHTYWSNPGDSGIPPTLTWTLPNGFAAGEVQYLAPDRERVGPLVDYAYGNDAYYLVAITPPSILRAGTVSILALKADWLVCKDICVPEKGELSLSLPAGEKAEPGDDAKEVAQLVSRLPVPVASVIDYTLADKQIRFDVPLAALGVASSAQVKSALFFPESTQLISNAAEQKVEVGAAGVSFAITSAEGKIDDKSGGVLSLFLNTGARKDYSLQLKLSGSAAAAGTVKEAAASSAPQPATPVKEVTAIPIAPPDQDQEHLTVLLAIWYALLGGLILNAMPCVFPVLSLKALAITKKAQAHPAQARSQGIAYTVGVIASFLALAFMLVIFQKSGEVVGWGYQLQSPIVVTLLAILMFVVSLNLAGYFELPVLLGGVGGEAAARDNWLGSLLTGMLAVMVATPCTAPFMASAIGFALTQSVATIFAVFAALGLGLASPFLLISLFPSLIRALPKPGAWMNTFKELLSFPMFGWTVWMLWALSREAGADITCSVLLGMVLIAFAIWLFRREASWVQALGFITGITGIAFAISAAQIAQPNQLIASGMTEHFSAEKLESLRKDGKAVFVDATADWCLICKVNEANALSSSSVMQAFKEKGIAYLVADWTHGEPDITRYLASFGRSGVPIYVYYPPGGGEPKLLPQLLTPGLVLEALK